MNFFGGKFFLGGFFGADEPVPEEKPLQGYDDRDEELLALLIPIFMETVFKEAA